MHRRPTQQGHHVRATVLIVAATELTDRRSEHFYPAGDGVGTFLCGPPGLIEKAALPGLEELGFKDGESVFGY